MDPYEYLSQEYFPNNSELAKHQIIHCEVKLIKLLVYSCQNCNLTFHNQVDYELHLLKHMKYTGELACSQCDKIVHTREGLEYHLLGHFQMKKFSCEICEIKFITKSQLVGHSSTHLTEGDFKCDVCTKTFTRKTYLLKHQENHDNRNNYECPKCNKLFKTKRTLANHKRIVHVSGASDMFNCTEANCKKSFQNPTYLRIHVKLIHNTQSHKYICTFCSKTFYYENQLEEHLRVHHTREKPFKCDQCDSCFIFKNLLKDHILQNHQGGLKPFKCTHPNCGATFALKYQLRMHMRKHIEKLKCSICPKLFLSQWQLKHHESTAHRGEKPYSCKICSKSFPWSSSLAYHMRIHRGERPYSCKFDECTKKFADSSALGQHIKIVHKKLKKCTGTVHQCNYCENQYLYASSLRDHVNSIHTKEKKFLCTLCTKVFYNNDRLAQYIRTHTREKPFPCKFNECGQSFSCSSGLAAHTKRLHSNTDQHIYGCEYCEKKYKSNGGLSAHVNSIHTKERKFPCAFCPKVFYKPGALTDHFGIHTGDKQFVCKHAGCGMTFISRGTLASHIKRLHSENLVLEKKIYRCKYCEKKYSTASILRTHINSIHTQVKKFQCSFCPKIFYRNANLTLHLRVHTGEKPCHCEICDKYLSCPKSLMDHTNAVHKGLKLHECKDCNVKFGKISGLYGHRKKFHSAS